MNCVDWRSWMPPGSALDFDLDLLFEAYRNACWKSADEWLNPSTRMSAQIRVQSAARFLVAVILSQDNPKPLMSQVSICAFYSDRVLH